MYKKSHLISLFISFAFIAMGQNPKHWDIKSAYKPAENPILTSDSLYIFKNPVDGKKVKWQKAEVFNPAVIIRKGKVNMLFRAEDNPKAILGGRTSRIGLATSRDGYHFKKRKKPVLFPAKDEYLKYDSVGGCEDPRVVQSIEGQYIIAYTSWDGKTARLSIAVSKNLKKWTKTGPAFAKAYNAKYLNLWSKSGSIVTQFINGKPVAAKIKGKYWMYWGETFINLAWSENLTDWYPLEDEKGNLKQLVKTRPGYFDSDLTECGPPAIITDKGVALLYNGKNATDTRADSKLPKGTYSVGQVIFDLNDLEKVVERSETYFLKPTLPHEMTGQYQAGTTFAEGLIYFKNKWWLYYGTADSFVGLALMD
ncbi:MAG: glycoside hydrolase family 130 protein [Bacteroidota bacterium]